MYKKVKLAGIISTLILSASAYSAEMTVGFSQIGSESGWRAAETSVAKSEAQKRGITLKIADAQQKQENQKNICAVYAHNDDMAIGAIQAIKEAGLKPGTDIKIISIDGVPDIFKAMMAGEANASVELTPNMAGPAFDALLAYKKDGTQPPKLIKTESILFEPESAEAQLELKKDMGY